MHNPLIFDFIVVGAGSAGCVLTERLSASGRFTVLVLEAGGTDRRFFIQMPLGYGKIFYDPSINWMYEAEPDPGLAGQRDYWPRGKVLGGSSSINAMVYIRGHPQDFEDWKAAGNPGWGWSDALDAYKAIEQESGGPLYVSDVRKQCHPLCATYIEAAGALGLPFNPDFNGGSQEGVGYYQINMKNGRRMSAARAFLRPAMKRSNVRVETNAHVTRILFDGARATGVEYRRSSVTATALAGREVIVAGGAVNSPQLLQLSGIGPGALLHEHGIAVLHDNPQVGGHLQDHMGINYTWRMKVPTLNDELRPWWGKLRAGLRYLLMRRGPLALSINQAGGFFRTDRALPRPNIQLYMQPFSTLIPKQGERPLLNPDPFSGLSLGLSNCRPTSRGTIAIRSADPFTHPRIVANAYATDHDVTEMLAAVKVLRKLASQAPLADLIAEELRPGPSCRSDDELIADIRQRSGTVYHVCGTCRMGHDAASAAVDSRLRVHGLHNLRVCDASIFPNIISGNTNAPAMMVGWKGAELVLADNVR
jgi:choline dehydrogenase